jgi:hypothetical protein
VKTQKKGENNFLSNASWFPEERSFYEGSQAAPVCPSGKSSVQMRTSMELLWPSDQPVAEAATCATHSKHKRRTSMPLAGFETAIQAIKWVQDYALPHGHRGRSSIKYYTRGSATCCGYSSKMLRLFTETFSVRQNTRLFFYNIHINTWINLRQNLVFMFHKFAASTYSMFAYTSLPLLKFVGGQIR